MAAGLLRQTEVFRRRFTDARSRMLWGGMWISIHIAFIVAGRFRSHALLDGQYDRRAAAVFGSSRGTQDHRGVGRIAIVAVN
jgi:hypothetical protein